MWPTARRPKRTSGTIAMARSGLYLKIERDIGHMSKLQSETSKGWLGNLSDSGKGEAIVMFNLGSEGFQRCIEKDVASDIASEGNGMQILKLPKRMT